MQKIRFALNGQNRKQLANAIGKYLGMTPDYLKAPTYAYQIGDYTVDQDGNLTCADSTEISQEMLFALEEEHFNVIIAETTDELDELTTSESSELTTPEVPEEKPEKVVFSYPSSIFTGGCLEKLKALVQSKKTLLMHSLMVDELDIIVEGDTISFPWLTVTTDADMIMAVADLIGAMINMANRQRSISSEEKPTTNEKFSFRLFLVRLGLKGDKFRETRRLLLENLTGNSAWKDGEPPKPEEIAAVAEIKVAGKIYHLPEEKPVEALLEGSNGETIS